MEIRKTPSHAARPVEKGRERSRWPWLLAIIILVIALLTGVLLYFYFVGRNLDKKAGNNTAATQTTEEVSNLAGLTINPEKDQGEQTNLLFSAASNIDETVLKLLSINSKDEDLAGSSLASLDRARLSGAASLTQVSPNSQFVYLLGQDHSSLYLVRLNQLSGSDLSGSSDISSGTDLSSDGDSSNTDKNSGDVQKIFSVPSVGNDKGDLNLVGNAKKIAGAAWLPDSSGIIVSLFKAASGSDPAVSEFVLINLKTGEVKTYHRDRESGESQQLIPLAVKDGELFVKRLSLKASVAADSSQGGGSDASSGSDSGTNTGSANNSVNDSDQNGRDDGSSAGQSLSLGVIKLGENNSLDGKLEKITNLSDFELGEPTISPDGRFVAWAKGSGLGDRLGETAGPYILELLDRTTGELTTLRESKTERYAAPIFTRDGNNLLYGASSGIWRLNLDTKKRTQIIDVDNVADLGSGETLEPVAIRPDDQMVLVKSVSDQGGDFFVAEISSGAELNALKDAPRSNVESNFLGWY